MALKKMWGGETGTAVELATVQAGVSNDAVAATNSGGARSLKCDGSPTSNTWLADALGGLSAIYVAMRFRADFSSAPSANRACRLATTTTSGGSTSLGFCNMQHLTNGNWRIFFGDGAGGQVQGTAYEWAYQSGTWIDIRFYMHKDGGWIKINGTTVYTLSQTNVLWSTGTIDRITGLSCSSNDTGRPFWLDDYCVGDTDMGGNPSVIARQPNAEGTHTSWSASTGTKVGCVSLTPADTSTYISYSSFIAGGAQTFTVNSFSSTESGKGSGTIGANDTVLGAGFAGVLLSVPISLLNMSLRRIVGGVTTNLSVTLAANNTWYYVSTVSTSGANRFPIYPSLSDLNGAEVGVVYGADSFGGQRCAELWITAAYLPPQGTEYTRTAALAGACASSATATRIRGAASALAASGALASAWIRMRPASMAVSGAGTVAATWAVVRGCLAALAGAGASINVGGGIRLRTVSLTGAGSLAAARTVTRGGVAALIASGVVASAATRARYRLAALLGQGAAATAATRTRERTGTASGLAVVAAAATKYTSIYIMPDADIATNGWTAVGAASLFDAIDDVNVNDADYILSPENPSGQACALSLAGQELLAPVSIRYRAARIGGSAAITIKLMEGAAERVSRSRILTDDLTDYEDVLTSEEIVSVTSWSNVTVMISAV